MYNEGSGAVNYKCLIDQAVFWELDIAQIDISLEVSFHLLLTRILHITSPFLLTESVTFIECYKRCAFESMANTSAKL